MPLYLVTWRGVYDRADKTRLAVGVNAEIVLADFKINNPDFERVSVFEYGRVGAALVETVKQRWHFVSAANPVCAGWFERMLKMHRHNYRAGERHGFWIDCTVQRKREWQEWCNGFNVAVNAGKADKIIPRLR